MVEDISTFLLYVAPGFIAIEIYRHFYPSKERPSYVYLAQTVVLGVLVLFIVRAIDFAFPELRLHSDTSGVPGTGLAFALGVTAVAFGLLWAGQLRFRGWLSKRAQWLNWLAAEPDAIWPYVNRPAVDDWAVVYLDDGSIYRGWIKRYRFDPDADHQDFLLSNAARVDDDLNEKYPITGIGLYLDTRNVNRIEFFEGKD